METNFWIEKGWGESVENATFRDVEIAIEETINMDEEHGAFWAGNMENENVLEVHKGLKIFFISEENPDEQKVQQLNSWEDVRRLFRLFFNEDYAQLNKEF